MHFTVVGVGGVVERLARAVGTEGHGDGAGRPQPGCELGLCEAAPALGCELEDLVTDVVADKVGAIVLGGPDAVWHERSAGDGPAPRLTVTVLVDRRCVGRGGAAYRASTVGVVVATFAEVPAVVGPCRALVDLLPGVLANVVYKESRTGGIG